MSQIWALARNLVVEVLRMRPLMVFVVFLYFGYTFGFGYWLHLGSGTAEEKIQTFLSYSLSTTGHFLAFLTIFVSIATITRDIKHKQLFTVATKPVSRGGYLGGKFLGMGLLNLLLLLAAGGTIYGLVKLGARLEPGRDPDPEYSRARLDHLILVARQGVHPSIVGVPEEQIARQAQQEAEKNLEEFVDQYYITDPAVKASRLDFEIDESTKKVKLRYRSIPPGSHITWHFAGVKPRRRENGLVFIRYKQEVTLNPADLAVTGQWWYGPGEDVFYTGKHLQTRDSIRTPHEFPIEAESVSETGDLYLTYRNPQINNPTTVIFPLPGKRAPHLFEKEIGIEALYVAGGFTGNFLRALLLIYLRLLFLSALGITLGAWLSFPVAVLTGLVIFTIGLCSNFILSSIRFEFGAKWFNFSNLAMFFFPRFAAYDPIPQIEKGRLVSYQVLGSCLLILILIKGGIVGFAGYLIFKFRELARVIV
ncbi:MAG: hypothetical protein AMJ79_04610 [Phycisphaerae bacterium SM23_30]|nr:MAG: hypothetical protein AMJ79_04610 [Phycisphaerae bacterium SM23_30]